MDYIRSSAFEFTTIEEAPLEKKAYLPSAIIGAPIQDEGLF